MKLPSLLDVKPTTDEYDPDYQKPTKFIPVFPACPTQRPQNEMSTNRKGHATWSPNILQGLWITYGQQNVHSKIFVFTEHQLLYQR